jgi:hypothetical protein
MISLVGNIGQKASADSTSVLTKELKITGDQTVNTDFVAKKGTPIFISSKGGLRSSADGFNGRCDFYKSDGTRAYEESNYSSLYFKEESVYALSFFPGYSGTYQLRCKMDSNSNQAIFAIAYTSVDALSFKLGSLLGIPGLDSRVLRFKTQKDVPIFVSVSGSQRSSASGFSGSCDFYRGNGQRAFEESNYSSLNFQDEISYQVALYPSYSGDYFLSCKNNSREHAKLSLTIWDSASQAKISTSTISIPGVGVSAFSFTAIRDETLSLSSRGSNKTTASGFSGKCEIFNGIGKRAFSETNYSSLAFSSGSTYTLNFRPSYTGVYFMVCINGAAESAKIQFSGYRELSFLDSSLDFFTSDSVAALGPNSGITPKANPSPTPSGRTSPLSSTDSDSQSCPDFVFVGARGSGERTPNQPYADPKKPTSPAYRPDADAFSATERSKWKDWLGNTNGELFTSVLLKGDFALHSDSVNTVVSKRTIAWISYGVVAKQTIYPAQGVPGKNVKDWQNYLAEVSALNSDLLKATLLKYTKNCPNTDYFLAGYSQGAAIVRSAVSKLSSKQDSHLLSHIKAVVLIADPLQATSDSRIPISQDRDWTWNTNGCGVVRILIVDKNNCGSANSLIRSSVAYKIFETLSVDIRVIRTFLNPSFDTKQLSRSTGINKIATVCFNGDAICAPVALRTNLHQPQNIHTNTYKAIDTADSVAAWILR